MAGVMGNPWNAGIAQVLAKGAQAAPLSREVAKWAEGAHRTVAEALTSGAEEVGWSDLLAPGLVLQDETHPEGWLTPGGAAAMLHRMGLEAFPPEVGMSRAVVLLARVVREVDVQAHAESLKQKKKPARGWKEGQAPTMEELMPEVAAERLLKRPEKLVGFVRRREPDQQQPPQHQSQNQHTQQQQQQQVKPAPEVPPPAQRPRLNITDMLSAWRNGDDEDDDDDEDQKAQDTMPPADELHMRPYSWLQAHSRCRSPEERRQLSECVTAPLLAALPSPAPLSGLPSSGPEAQQSAWAMTCREAVKTMAALLQHTAPPCEEALLRLWSLAIATASAATAQGAWRDTKRFLANRAAELTRERLLSLAEKEVSVLRSISTCKKAAERALQTSASKKDQVGQTAEHGKGHKVFRRDTHAHRRD